MEHTRNTLKTLTATVTIVAAAVALPAVAGEEQTGKMLKLAEQLKKNWQQASEYRKKQSEERSEVEDLRNKAWKLQENTEDPLDDAEAGAKMLRAQAKANYQDRKLVEFCIRTGRRSIGILRDMREVANETGLKAEQRRDMRNRQKRFMGRMVPALVNMLDNAENELQKKKVKTLRRRLINKYKATQLKAEDGGMDAQLKSQIRKMENFCSDMATAKKLLEDERRRIAMDNSKLNIRAVGKYVNRLKFADIPIEKWSGKIIDSIADRRQNRQEFMKQAGAGQDNSCAGSLNTEEQAVWDEMTSKYGEGNL